MKLYAADGYADLTEAQRRDICNGCGTKGLIGFLVPDSIWFLSIKEACNIHDYGYVVGETIADKEREDRGFLNNMLRIIEEKTRWAWLKRRRARVARLYYCMVVRYGGPAFWRGKNKPENEVEH